MFIIICHHGWMADQASLANSPMPHQLKGFGSCYRQKKLKRSRPRVPGIRVRRMLRDVKCLVPRGWSSIRFRGDSYYSILANSEKWWDDHGPCNMLWPWHIYGPQEATVLRGNLSSKLQQRGRVKLWNWYLGGCHILWGASGPNCEMSTSEIPWFDLQKLHPFCCQTHSLLALRGATPCYPLSHYKLVVKPPLSTDNTSSLPWAL